MQHLTDDVVFARIKRESTVQMIAPKLTSFMVDTGACYHMGSRVTKGNTRLMFTALYTSYPFIYPNVAKNSIAIVSPLSGLQQMAVRT